MSVIVNATVRCLLYDCSGWLFVDVEAVVLYVEMAVDVTRV